MKSKLQLIEALEPRVAPALLVNGGNLLGGAGNPTTGETSTGANTVTLVKVLSGQALVFFDNGTITGISVGKHTKLDITGDLAGDIITNLGPDGRLTDTDNNPINGEDGGVLLPISIKGITTHPLSDEKGSVGRIIAGAQINNINIAGELAGLYSGDGIFRDGDFIKASTGRVDFNTVEPGLQNTFTFAKGFTAPNNNSTIKNVTINTARQLEIFSGSGQNGGDGTGVAGSDIINVTIAKTLAAEGTNPVVSLHAGDGGAGATGGGKGGSISSFNDQGSIAYVKLQTGNGGDSSDGAGGKGGLLQSSTIVSSSPRYDFLMGNGGNGQTGGDGGGISSLNFTNNITGGKSLIATADFNNDGVGDVILLNTLTGESTVSLGRAGDNLDRPGEANFVIAVQTITQPNGINVQTPFLPAEGANPTSLVVADFNGDGLLDFAVSYASTNSLGIYTNHVGFYADQFGNNVLKSGGAFTPTRLDLAVSPTRIAVGDFAGTGHTDIAVVSAGSLTSQQFGVASGVYVVGNDGAGNLTFNPTPATSLPGIATEATAAQAYTMDEVPALLGANLYVGFKSGSVSPVTFRSGAATVQQSLPSFPGVPVNDLDVVQSNGVSLLLAFSKDIDANVNANDPTASPRPEVIVYTLDANGISNSITNFFPASDTTRAEFLPQSNIIGTVTPNALVLSAIQGTTGRYETLTTLSSSGVLSNFDADLIGNTYQFAVCGAATNRFFFTTGVPGGTAGVKPLLASETPNEPQVISFDTGNGGNGDSLDGGTGGSVKIVTFIQSLSSGVLEAGGAYNTVFATGHGGDSNGGEGGKGGGIRKTDLSLNPGYLTYSDDTTSAIFTTGEGGRGTTGGDGGSIQKVSTTAVYKEIVSGGVVANSLAVRMTTGDGGVGTTAAGGSGGNVSLAGQSALSGVSFVDDDSQFANQAGLLVTAGNGGNGITAGGAGGSLKNVGSQNATVGGAVVAVTQLSSAILTSGSGGAASGGDGGAGGTLTGTNVTVQTGTLAVVLDGKYLRVTSKDGAVTARAGDGGVGLGGAGGAGGALNKSTVGSVTGDGSRHYGVLMASGNGGDGNTGGGAGGDINKVIVNSPSDSRLYAAVIAAGDGGDAQASGPGGAGGSIKGIKQAKDVNSSINVIQAGDGGRGAGDAGGAGGSVTSIQSVGFIGLPSTQSANNGAFFDAPFGVPAAVASLFASAQIPQGIFAGQGGDGAANGSVLNVVARQIAAIGASVQANGRFAVASEVDNITADLIGYQVNRGGPFQSSDGQGTSPAANRPVDGFILASVVSNINTVDNGRTAQFTFLG